MAKKNTVVGRCINRREFLWIGGAGLFVGCGSFGTADHGEDPVVRFGMVTDIHYADHDEDKAPVGVVGRGAFRGCTSLREVRFSPLLRILGADAFSGCTSLRRADVPDSCTRIGPGAFDRCPLAPGAEPEPHAESAELASHAESAEGL